MQRGTVSEGGEMEGARVEHGWNTGGTRGEAQVEHRRSAGNSAGELRETAQ